MFKVVFELSWRVFLLVAQNLKGIFGIEFRGSVLVKIVFLTIYNLYSSFN